MKVVVCHNYYREWGGEDKVFEDECAMLTAYGHEVHTYVRRNDEFSGLQTIAVGAGTIWNPSAASAIGALVREVEADVVHFHNCLPQISRGAFYAARRAGAAVVETLHNYRFVCANGVFFRDGAICEDCVGKAVGWPAVVHGCYRNSRIATAPVVAAIATHKALGTNDRAVDATIVLTEFARTKLIESGLPSDGVHLKPNFVDPDPGEGRGEGGYYLYVGRLTDDKGVRVLIDAWNMMDDGPLLKVAGTGLLSALVEEAAEMNPRIEYLGYLPSAEISPLLGEAKFSLMPTLNYEGHPKAIVESFSVGTPVIGSDLGSVAEVIDSHRTGLLFDAGSPTSLVEAVREAEAMPNLEHMRDASRHEYLSRYRVERNVRILEDIYANAIKARHKP